MKKLLMPLALLAALCGQNLTAATPPSPCGATPTNQQVDWLRMEWYAFVHFSLNTYTNKEWGYGDESPKLFNPTQFDADPIIRTFRDAGMTGMIYTAKHHDGWCAWPTKSTKHNITQSPWKNGRGDVVKEFATACKKYGLKFGTYLSPWDRNCAEYGKKGYLNVYYKQITELLTNYGPIFEIWFDGANGGDGYYGGAREKRNIGKADDYYDFARVVKLIRRLQPDCIIWGAAQRGDVIWGGSEKGHVKYPCWNLINKDTPQEKWISLEGDTPINHAGWFWHPGQETKVKSPEHLMQVYLDSVGRGANLILNVAPNREGKLDPADVESLLTFGENRRRLLATDYALGAAATASEVRGNDPQFGAEKLTDGDIESYWCPNDGTTGGTLEITLKKPTTFDVVRLREQIRLGQRITGFKLEARVNGSWQVIDDAGQTIGHQVMRKLAAPVTADAVRLTITGSRACPCISELSLLRMPVQMPKPEISREGDKLIITPQEGLTIHYTTNGSNPGPNAPVYTGNVTLDKAPTHPVKAVYVDAEGNVSSVASVLFGISRNNWSCVEAGKEAIDGDPTTIWEADKAPAALTIDMQKPYFVNAFSYLPRQDGSVQNMTDRFTCEVSLNGKKWTTVAEGEFSNLRANPIELTEQFKARKARYIRFTGTRSVEGKGVSAAEIKVYAAPKPEKSKKKG